MNVLVTGGAGFIGHNIALHLKRLGYGVTAFDSLKRATEFACRRLASCSIPIIKGDVLNSRSINAALRNVDVAIHAAAYISVKESMKKPALYIRNNVAGTASIAKACLQKRVGLIYISSAAVYGEPSATPISENHPTIPISPYGLSKLMGEQIVEFYAKQGLKYAVLRLFNVYGPGQSSAYAGVITCFINRLSEGKPPIIYGDGQQTRDFIHVYDVAEAIRLAIEGGLVNEAINIATGKPTAIKDLAELLIKLTRRDLKPIFMKARIGDVKHSYADISKAKSLLGFKPKINLEEGLIKLIEEQLQARNKP